MLYRRSTKTTHHSNDYLKYSWQSIFILYSSTDKICNIAGIDNIDSSNVRMFSSADFVLKKRIGLCSQ